MTTDPLRSAIYGAEFDCLFYDDLHADRKHPRIRDAQRFVDRVLAMPDVLATYGQFAIEVRPHREHTFSVRDEPVIYLEPIAGRYRHEILHEVAHQITDQLHGDELPAHSSVFAGVYSNLVGWVYGPDKQEELLRSYIVRQVPVQHK